MTAGNRGGLRLVAPAIDAARSDDRALRLGRLLVALIDELAPSAPDDLLTLAEAARAAATSLRVVREAIRGGALPAFGGQRDRAVRRVDLAAWIECRRVKPDAADAVVDDDDVERRMRRLARPR